MNGVGAVLGPDASTATGAAALAVVAGGFFPDGAGVGLAAGDCLAAGAALVAGVVDAVEKAVDVYKSLRADGERFLDTYRRVGEAPFKEAIYG